MRSDYDKLYKHFSELISNVFTDGIQGEKTFSELWQEGFTTASSEPEGETLDWDKLKETIEELEKSRTIYYADTEHLPDLKDRVLVVPESKWGPEYIVIHSDDLESIKDSLEREGFKMVHVRDIPPEIRHKKMIEAIREDLNEEMRNRLKEANPYTPWAIRPTVRWD